MLVAETQEQVYVLEFDKHSDKAMLSWDDKEQVSVDLGHM